MIEILEEVQKFVPATCHTANPEFINSCVFGGDQLTCERARNSQRHRKDSATTEERLEGLVPTVEDWHTKMNFYEASNRLLLLSKNNYYCHINPIATLIQQLIKSIIATA